MTRKITLGLFFLLLFSFPGFAQMSGLYTINALGTATAGNYLSVNAAVSDLAYGTRPDGGPVNGPGVTGPVTLRIVSGSGPYFEQVTFPTITGASATNTIRLTGGPGRETITFAGTTTSSRHVVKIDGARHIILDSLTLVNTDAVYGYGVHITNSADSNVVKNCSVTVDNTTTSSNFAGITLSGATVTTSGDFGDDNLVQNNTVNGGYYGLSMHGSSTTVFNQRNKFINNTVVNFYYMGIYSYYENLPEIIGNTITARSTATTSAYGMYLYYTDQFKIEKNKITTAGTYGIYSYYGNYQSGTGTARASIINNMIGGSWLSTTPYGIYLSTNSRNIDLWHNSLSVTGNGRDLYIIGGSGNNVQNNSFAIFGSTTGYAMYVSSTTYVTGIDYNNYYAPGSSNFIYIGAAYTPATFIGGGGYNTNSRNGDPIYINNTNNLHSTGAQLYDYGANLGITTDIDGDARPLAPSTGYDIGADEYSPALNDAGVTAVTSPVQPFSAGIQNIGVTIYNFGISTLTSATINWKVNNVLQTPYSWTGSLATYTTSSPITIGTYNFATGNSYTLKLWTSNPNGSADQNTLNDTLTVNLCVGLSGVYRIGGVGADFPTINAAVAALVCGGVSGPVTLNLTQGAGPFNEQVVIPSIPGASATRTIRINGGANRETVTYGNTTNTLRAVFMIDGARHITLDSMTIENTGISYGYGVQITNSADSNTVKNCIVNISPVTTSSNFAGITLSGSSVTASGDFGDGNLIQNNTVNGGYYGITMHGTSSVSFNQGNRIINNVVQDFYYYGIYSYAENLAEITGNTIIERATGSTFAYGIYMYYTEQFKVERNKISTIGTYGLYSYYGNYQSGTGTARSSIANNMFGGTWLSTSPYAMYLSTNNRNLDIWHNSISLTGNGRCLYMISGSGNDVRNNSFAVYNSTSGYALYVSSPSYVSQIENNNYYAPGSSNFIYIGAAYTPATFIGGGGFNFNSRTGDPYYINPTTNLHTVYGALYDWGANLGVTTDIDGDVRPLAPSTGYDVGADEFVAITDDAVLTTLLTPYNSTCADSNGTVSVIITNQGIDTLFTLPLTATVTGYTTATLSYTYTGSLTFGQSDTVTLGQFNSSPGGLLTITTYTGLSGDQNHANDTIVRQVVITPIAPVAVGTNDTACTGDPITIGVNIDGNAHNWYDAATGGNFLHGGDTYTTPALTSTTTYYVESLSRSDSSLTTSYAGGSGCEGIMFDVVPALNMRIDSFALNIGSTFTETVRVYYRNGTFSGNEGNSAAWTLLGGPIQVIGAGAGQPTIIPIGGLYVNASQTYGIYIALGNSNVDYSVGSTSYTNGEMQINNGTGLCSPFGGLNYGRIFNGSVFYTKEICPNPVRTPVTVTVLSRPAVALGNDTTVCGSHTLDAGTTAISYLWSTSDTTQTLNVNTTGVYSVIISDGLCPNWDTIQVAVNPLPVLNTTVSSPAICNGGNDTLTATGAVLYTWSSGGNSATEVVAPPVTSTYTVTGIDGNGCVNSTTVTVNVNQLPNVSYTATSTAVCIGDNLTLSGTGANSYVWTGSISNGVPFTPSTSGSYMVTGTDGNGCSDTATAFITVNPLPTVGYTASTTLACQNDPVTLSGTGASTYTWTGGITDNVPFSVIATSTYTVTGIDVNGCSNTASVTISVNPAPTVGNTVSDPVICAGDSVIFNGTGAVSYSWSGGVTNGVPYFPTSTNTYTVTGTGTNGCTATSTVTVTVNSLPNVTLTLPFSTLCVNDGSVFLTGGSPSGGTWSGTAIIFGVFDPNAAGVGTHPISYIYTNAYGCTSSATQQVTVDACAGVSDPVAENQFIVFPNPSGGNVTVALNGMTGQVNFVLFNSLGQPVQSFQLNADNNQFNVGPLAAGAYLLVGEKDGMRYSQRIIVQQ